MSRLGLHRGDVVIVDFLPTKPNAFIRPALVVQNDRDNARTVNTIVVQITRNLTRAHEDTHLLIDSGHPDWQNSGLATASAVNCSTLAYVDQQDVLRIIGQLSAATMQRVDSCLKAALGLP